MQRGHFGKDCAFAGESCCIEAGTDADAIVERQTGQARQQHRCGGGVANAHLAEQQCVAGQHTDHLAAVGNSLCALRWVHGWADRRVGGTRSDLANDQARNRCEIVPHAAVDHRQRQPMLAREHAHRRTAAQKVLHHLPGHVARIGRHAARRQPVVASAHQQLRMLQRR